MKKVVKNGIIVTESNHFMGDILIEDGKISAIGKNFDEAGADEIIDASGMYVLPGGVDQHTHYLGADITDPFTNKPKQQEVLKYQDFTSTWAALQGGTTTIVNFMENLPGKGLLESFEINRKEAMEGKACCDYGIHAICTEVNELAFDEVAKLPEIGINSLKVFMAYKPSSMYVDDYNLFKFMEECKKAGVTMMVHAESADLTNVLRDKYYNEGHTEPKYHILSRPPIVEEEATRRAILIAEETGCPLVVVHVTCEGAVKAIKEARDKGLQIIGETCTHYLVTDNSVFDTDDYMKAAIHVCSPAHRERKDCEYLWTAVKKDWLGMVSSDHARKCIEELEQNGRDDFRKIPNGKPGAAERLVLLWTYGYEQGKLSLERLADVLAAAPAKLCGMYPQKGTICVGSDADIVIYDPSYRGTMSLENNPSGTNYSVFEGYDQIGRVETVLLRGSKVVDKHMYIGHTGDGQFVPGKAFASAYNI